MDAYGGAALLIKILYHRNRFDDDVIARMLGHFKTLLEVMAACPEERVGQLPMLTEAEREQLLGEWNDTATEFPRDKCVHQLFEEQAGRTPDALAVADARKQWTYAELNRRAELLAAELRKFGIGPDVCAGVCLERSVEMVTAKLAVWKAGGAYVPLDPSYPAQRLQAVVEDAKLRLVVSDRVSSQDIRLWDGVELLLADDVVPEANLAADCAPASTSLAYVIYTSGSTGEPRGVEVTHRNLVNSTQARLAYYQPGQNHFLLLSSFAFDSSLAGIFGTLCGGGTLVIPSGALPANLPNLAKLVAAHEITDLLCVPSLYRLMLEQATRGEVKSLRRVIVAGESCPPDLLERHYKLLPTATLYNEYGPTEATVWATVHPCETRPKRVTVSIGKPIANTQIYVLDQRLRPVPSGVQGELCIAGESVARGYWNQPELTAAKFVTNPFGKGKLYRTGDLGRHLPDGSLELLGRLDAQIKIRGFRIELEEISSHIAAFPGVLQAAATVFETQAGQPEIIAYIVPESPQANVTYKALRRYLKDRLPEYMLPSAALILDALPLLPNGKLDRNALPMPERSLAGVKDKPANLTEEKLVAVFEKVLEKQPVGTGQSFFELGGHSLLLARLLLLIEENFAVQLSWAEVFRFPTVRELATLLNGQSREVGSNAIIPIQPSGSKLPLFWVRGGPLFLGLSRGLGLDQPLLGLDLPPADAVHLPVPYRLEDIAAALIEKMRSVQPEGPYNIAGLCVNGVIAYEMARQLEESGQTIGVLALFDAQNPEFYHNFGEQSTQRAAWNKIGFHLNKFLSASPAGFCQIVRERLKRAGQRLNVLRWRIYHHFAWRVQERHLRNLDIIIHPSSYSYHPKPLSCNALFFQSSDWPKGSYWDFYASWKDMIRDLRVYRVRGGHESMFAEKNVAPIIEGLRQGLEEIYRPVLSHAPAETPPLLDSL